MFIKSAALEMTNEPMAVCAMASGSWLRAVDQSLINNALTIFTIAKECLKSSCVAKKSLPAKITPGNLAICRVNAKPITPIPYANSAKPTSIISAFPRVYNFLPHLSISVRRRASAQSRIVAVSLTFIMLVSV